MSSTTISRSSSGTSTSRCSPFTHDTTASISSSLEPSRTYRRSVWRSFRFVVTTFSGLSRPQTSLTIPTLLPSDPLVSANSRRSGSSSPLLFLTLNHSLLTTACFADVPPPSVPSFACAPAHTRRSLASRDPASKRGRLDGQVGPRQVSRSVKRDSPGGRSPCKARLHRTFPRSRPSFPVRRGRQPPRLP
jgi:hypothetical protein